MIERLRELTRAGDPEAAASLFTEATRRGDDRDRDLAARTLLATGRWRLETGTATIRPIPAGHLAQQTWAGARAIGVLRAPDTTPMDTVLDALTDATRDAETRAAAALDTARQGVGIELDAVCLEGAAAWTVHQGSGAIVRLRAPDDVAILKGGIEFPPPPPIERVALEPGDLLIAVSPPLVDLGDDVLRQALLSRPHVRLESACEVLLGRLSGVREPVSIAALRLHAGPSR